MSLKAPVMTSSLGRLLVLEVLLQIGWMDAWMTDGRINECLSYCRSWMFPSLKQTQAPPHKNRLGQSGAVWSRRAGRMDQVTLSDSPESSLTSFSPPPGV